MLQPTMLSFVVELSKNGTSLSGQYEILTGQKCQMSTALAALPGGLWTRFSRFPPRPPQTALPAGAPGPHSSK